MRTAKENRECAWRTLAEKDAYGAFLLGQLLLQFIGMTATMVVSSLVVLVLALMGIAALVSRIVKTTWDSVDPLQQLDKVHDDLVALSEKFTQHPETVAVALLVVAAATLVCLYIRAFSDWGRCAMSVAAVRGGLRVSHSISGWGNGWRMVGLNVWIGLLVTLQFLLFVAPGVRAAFAYWMAPYLMIDHPDWSARQCIAESKRLMEGNRWRLFCLLFSFIGWILLVVLLAREMPMLGGLAMLFLTPYMNTASAHFYEELLDADCLNTHPEVAAESPSAESPGEEQESEEETEQERNQ